MRRPPLLLPSAATVVAARRVLVTGFASATADTAALACDLAEAVGAAVDPGDDDCGLTAGPTIARIGAVTADPEELRDRADLVVLWFCGPAADAKGFSDRCLTPATAAGLPRRTIAVGPGPAAPGHERCAVARAEAVNLARLLHAALVGIAVPESPGPLSAARAQLQAAISAAACVAIVTDHADPVGLEPWGVAGLVRALAHRKPAFEVPLAVAGDGGTVCTWRYGAAGGVARADRLGGEFRPAECDARRLVERGEIDCVVACGQLPEPLEAAIAARGPALAVVRTDADGLAELLAAVRAAALAGGAP